MNDNEILLLIEKVIAATYTFVEIEGRAIKDLKKVDQSRLKM
jgi:hypothetical protein